jgi:hypothetical protein
MVISVQLKGDGCNTEIAAIVKSFQEPGTNAAAVHYDAQRFLAMARNRTPNLFLAMASEGLFPDPVVPNARISQ